MCEQCLNQFAQGINCTWQYSFQVLSEQIPFFFETGTLENHVWFWSVQTEILHKTVQPILSTIQQWSILHFFPHCFLMPSCLRYDVCMASQAHHFNLPSHSTHSNSFFLLLPSTLSALNPSLSITVDHNFFYCVNQHFLQHWATPHNWWTIVLLKNKYHYRKLRKKLSCLAAHKLLTKCPRRHCAICRYESMCITVSQTPENYMKTSTSLLIFTVYARS